MHCRVCGMEAHHQFSRTILNKHSCSYFSCPDCGFLQTEEPYWLEEAYASAITTADTGLVFRNLHFSKLVSPLLFYLFKGKGKYLDFAGGYGMFTRLMRDIGFDFFWTDLYCENLIARGFEASKTNPPFMAVTAFEVLEHVPDPVKFFRDALSHGQTRTIIFSTELFEGTPPEPNTWWYYAFPTGQHIGFYQRRTLEAMAGKLGLHCHSNGSLHMLTDLTLSPIAYRLLTNPRLASLISILTKQSLTSKMMTDSDDIMTGRR